MELEYMTERRDYSVSEALKLAEWIWKLQLLLDLGTYELHYV